MGCSFLDHMPFNHKGWKNVVVILVRSTGIRLNTIWGIALELGDVT